MDKVPKMKIARYTSDLNDLLTTIAYANQDKDTQFVTMVIDRGNLTFAGEHFKGKISLAGIKEGLLKAQVIVAAHETAGHDIPDPPTDAVN
jgi:hypothetical protein